MNRPVVAVITGGPCGGKSTFLARVRARLEAYGLCPLIMSETATELINAGATPALLGTEAFQEHLLRYTLDREQHYHEIATRMTGKTPVILCDRGVLDCAAYMGVVPYQKMLGRLGFSQRDLMHRYDLVVHLVTAAEGAEAFYTLANNGARSETPEEARALDARTLAAWLGHPHHVIVDNSTDFAGKINRALSALARKFNMPEATEIERKFVITNFSPSMIPGHAVASKIVQDYLMCDGPGERRVRMRVRFDDENQCTYTYTEKVPTGESGKRIEREREISRAEYETLLRDRDPSLFPIEKVRYVFHSGGKLFELDEFQGHRRGLVMLEVELQNVGEEVVLPEGWEYFEGTDDKKYKNRSLAEPA